MNDASPLVDDGGWRRGVDDDTTWVPGENILDETMIKQRADPPPPPPLYKDSWSRFGPNNIMFSSEYIAFVIKSSSFDLHGAYYRKFETNIINSFQKMWNNRANRRRNTEYLLFKRESVTLDLDLHDEYDYVDEYESLIRQ